MKLDPKALDAAYNVVAYRHTADKGVLAEAIRTYFTAIGETHVLVPRGDLEQIVDVANRNEQSPEGDRLDALLSASAAKEWE